MSKEAADKSIFDKLTLGVVKSLEQRIGICDINLEQGNPCQKASISQWEQKHSCLMPDDLKSFYLTNNGFKLTWSVKLNDTRIPVGKMEINKLGNLNRIGGKGSLGDNSGGCPSLIEVDLDYEDGKDCGHPRFDHRSRIYELDPCEGYGKVCLVYNCTKPGIPASKAEVWFMDRALMFHYVCDSFLSFYRLMLLHLGLPQWQYIYTDIGLSPQAKQWFHMYSSERLNLTGHHPAGKDVEKLNSSVSPLDPGRVFKGKSDKRKSTSTTATTTTASTTATATTAQNMANKKKSQMVPALVKSGVSSLSRASGTSSQVSKMSK